MSYGYTTVHPPLTRVEGQVNAVAPLGLKILISSFNRKSVGEFPIFMLGSSF